MKGSVLWFSFALVVTLFEKAFCQSAYGVWHPPVEHTIYLSGSFGELRPNHFHGGVDIKSALGRSGDPILAVQDGYISRIMIHPKGYGLALSINHPSGFTTLYAHLDKFETSIQQYLWTAQRLQKSYILDYELAPHEFPIKMGQLIGYMGNTGYSFGPHLHFEVKRTSTDMLINPLLLGYGIKDQQPPLMRGLRIHALDSNMHELRAFNQSVRKLSGIYTPYKDTIRVKGAYGAVSLDAIDLMDDIHNKNGVHRLELFINDRLAFVYQMDSFPKYLTRFLNAHCDYNEIKQRGQYFHRLHKLKGNTVQLYPYDENNGYIDLRSGEAVKVKIAAMDFHKNQSVAHFHLQMDSTYTPPSSDQVISKINCLDTHLLQKDSIKVIIRENVLFEDGCVAITPKPNGIKNNVGPYYNVSAPSYPMVGSYSLGILSSLQDSSLREKVCLVACEAGSCTTYGGNWAGNVFSTDLKRWGAFTLVVDTTAPVIHTLQFAPKANQLKTFRFRIQDNLTPGKPELGLKITAHVNNEWVRGEYDKTSGILILYLDNLRGENLELELHATDNLGNTARKTLVFSR
jgi:hypothetical protein